MRTYGINSKKCTMYMNIDEKDKHVGWNLHFRPYKRDLLSFMFCFPSVGHVMYLRDFPLCLFIFYMYVCMWIRQNLKKYHLLRGQTRDKLEEVKATRELSLEKSGNWILWRFFFSFPLPPCSSQQLKLLSQSC